MQKLISILAFSFLAFSVKAQEAAPEKERSPLSFEAGVQANTLFARLFNNSNSSSGNPYLFTGKLVSGSTAFRLGAGGNRSRDEKTQDGFADSQTTLNQGVDLRLGVERRYVLGKKWAGS